MKNKTRRLAAFLLSAAVVITAVPGMQERVYAQKTGGYTESPKSENVPVVQETKSRLKKAEAVPSAYMNKLSELTIRYPGVRDQGKYDTCWAFSAIGLAEFDLIADNQTEDKSIDLSELQLAYFTYNNVEDPLGGTFGDSLNIMNHKNYLTMGGNLDFASRTLLQWEGVTDENRVPYALAPTTTTLAKSYAFDICYTSRPNWQTYKRIIDFVHHVASLLERRATLKPRDLIDVQSFIWCALQNN